MPQKIHAIYVLSPQISYDTKEQARTFDTLVLFVPYNEPYLHPNQGSECLGCLHSCWSPLSPHGPQARVRPSNGKISTLTFMSHLHQYHEYHHQNEKIHFQQTLSFSFHREGLPLTMKSCFYPLIGDLIFGWPGDLVDMIRFR